MATWHKASFPRKQIQNLFVIDRLYCVSSDKLATSEMLGNVTQYYAWVTQDQLLEQKETSSGRYHNP